MWLDTAIRYEGERVDHDMTYCRYAKSGITDIKSILSDS